MNNFTMTANEHKEADKACGREWVCACSACNLERQRLGLGVKVIRTGPRKAPNPSKKVTRVTVGTLDGFFGPDADRKVVIQFVPGDGRGIKDVLRLRPYKTPRWETVAVIDVYRFAIRSRVNAETLARARERKAKKAERLARKRLDTAERRFKKKIKSFNERIESPSGDPMRDNFRID